MSNHEQPLYHLRQVVKVREKGGTRFELSVPEMAVRPGRFIAVVGPSGCGKSTLLDLLGLVLQPSSAERMSLTLGDRTVDLTDLPESGLAAVRQSCIGYVLQTGGLLPFLSVADNIRLPLKLNGRTDDEGRVEALAARLGIADQLSKKPAHLSGGQRQRAAIARALAHRPPIVLADEPTAAVDELAALEIRDVFKELTAELGVTLIMVTHNWELIRGAVDASYTFDLTKPRPDWTTAVVREVA